ncbi:putative protein N(5)-glutamine methyltransferase [Paenibacillus thalictri]|uniref:peptide chain release factor N(5)-glutamine methyltransferase n=1 Tax=Paenibacillus thalictri TaxID=2527873 RepID=A0A4Q9DJE6_9BACL|nr:putative protein N(5)-glutamine methyltransferase [Paenibacillus thalictri]TBL71066.1 putative protein N(5)-glutamine methyltransferase [Paenibacillus thalictri]
MKCKQTPGNGNKSLSANPPLYGSISESTDVFATAAVKLRAAGCVFAEDEARLLISAAPSLAALAAMMERRVRGEPVEHVIGWAEFCGLRIEVDPGVFVPRQRSEFLVRQAAALAGPQTVIADLCCGSGALGVALASALQQAKLYSVDIDPAAVQCARRNAAVVCGHVFEGDLFEPLPSSLHGRVDIVLANAPYVPTDAIRLLPAEARVHEARIALDGGADGLDIQRRVAAEAPLWLAPGGRLLVETSQRQAPQTAELFVRSGLIAQVTRSDELDATIIIGTKPSA